MAARLGRVLYWACFLFGGLCVIGAAISYANAGYQFGVVVLAALGTVAWLVGRAARYVLAGE